MSLLVCRSASRTAKPFLTSQLTDPSYNVVCQQQGPPPPNPLVVERFQQVISQLFQQVILHASSLHILQSRLILHAISDQANMTRSHDLASCVFQRSSASQPSCKLHQSILDSRSTVSFNQHKDVTLCACHIPCQPLDLIQSQLTLAQSLNNSLSGSTRSLLSS